MAWEPVCSSNQLGLACSPTTGKPVKETGCQRPKTASCGARQHSLYPEIRDRVGLGLHACAAGSSLLDGGRDVGSREVGLPDVVRPHLAHDPMPPATGSPSRRNMKYPAQSGEGSAATQPKTSA